MGLNCIAFDTVLVKFQQYYETTPMKRSDSKNGLPRTWRRALDAAGVLGLVLHYLTSTMDDTALCQIFSITPTCCTRYLDWGLDLLLLAYKTVEAARIVWPTPVEMEKLSLRIQARRGKQTSVSNTFGFVDGCKLHCKQSLNDFEQSQYYNGWKTDHFISNVFCFDTQGCIIWASLNNPGSWHDSTCSKCLYDRLKDQTPDPYNILADTAFPYLDGKILKPLKTGDSIPRTRQGFAAAIKTSHEVTSERQAAEWGMRALQGAFPRLYVPTAASDHPRRLRMLTAVARTFNVRTRLVGINQLKTVYDEAAAREEDNPDVTFRSIAEQFYNGIFKPKDANARIRRYCHAEI